MHANQVRAAGDAQGDRGRRAKGPLTHGQVKREADHRLAGGAEEDWPPQAAQFAQAAQDLQVLPARLAEADPRIDDHLRGREAGGGGRFQATAEEKCDLPQQIRVVGAFPVVHGDDRHSGPGGYRSHLRVPLQSPDVVQAGGAGGQGRFGHPGLGGVHRDWHPHFAGHRAKDRQEPGQLLFFLNPGRPRPGRFGPDVQQIRAGRGHGLGPGHRGLDGIGRLLQAVAGKGVGSGVQDAHDVRAPAPDEFPAADRDGRRRRGQMCQKGSDSLAQDPQAERFLGQGPADGVELGSCAHEQHPGPPVPARASFARCGRLAALGQHLLFQNYRRPVAQSSA